MEYLSPTKLEQYRLCAARLMARYASDGEYEEEQGEPAKIGTLAHAAAKFWYRQQAATPDEAFKKGMVECAETKDYNGKPNSQLPVDPSGIQEARTMFDSIAAHYVRDSIKVVFAERKYKGPLRNQVPVNLIIDLGLDRGNGTLEIVDFKTGFLACTEEEMHDKDQVLLNLLATNLDPGLAQFSNKIFTYYWVKRGYETGPVPMGWDKLTDYEHYLAITYQEILDIKEPEESINRFCKSCGRRKECKKYNSYLAEAYGLENVGEVKPITPEQAANLEEEEILARLDRLNSQQKMLEANEKVLKEFIMGKLEAAKATEMVAGKYKGAIRQSKREEYQTSTILSLCSQFNVDPIPLLSPNKSKVDSVFSSNPTAQSALNMTMFRGATRPWLAITGAPKRKSGKKKKEETNAEAS
jgi:hypothetical protein